MEIVSPNQDVELYYNAKIGLMYVSDFYYGKSPTYWNKYSQSNTNSWLYMGLYEWTITRVSSDKDVSLYLYNGSSHSEGTSINYNFAIRPSFYLKYEVKITGGDGTKSNPYRISL